MTVRNVVDRQRPNLSCCFAIGNIDADHQNLRPASPAARLQFGCTSWHTSSPQWPYSPARDGEIMPDVPDVMHRIMNQVATEIVDAEGGAVTSGAHPIPLIA